MKTVIIGNGILGLTTAYRLMEKDPKTQILIIGPESHPGCASLAAAAMLNSFCEVDTNTLSNPIEKEKFLFNRSATALWPDFLKQLETRSKEKINYGFGTYVVDNHSTDELEDENFFAIVDALKQFNEPFDFINPHTIPHYAPSPQARAARAIFIPNEGFLNPVMLLNALKTVLKKSEQVTFINQSCTSLQEEARQIQSVTLDNNEQIFADQFILTPGANFSKILSKSNFKLDTPKIFYGVGCSLLIKTSESTLKNCVRTPNRGLACGIYAAPFDKEHIVVGASNFISATPEDYVRLTSAHTLLESVMEQLNTAYYRSQLVKVNVGWRPTSADTVPMIGQTSFTNLIVATGTKRDGLHCSPLISDLLVDLATNRQPKINLSLFTPERKLHRIYSRDAAIETTVKHTINAAYQHGFKSAKNRMVEDLKKYYTEDLKRLHDNVGAIEWGIPPEMVNMYKYGHIQ